MDKEQLEKLLDHMELVNWIHFMFYWSVGVGQEVVNMIDGSGKKRDFLVLPSSKRVVITIKVEEYKK